MAKKKLTKRELRAIPVSKLVLKKDTDWGEYQVRVYRGSHLDEGATYHAADKDDAVLTMAAMKKEYGLAGLRGRRGAHMRRHYRRLGDADMTDSGPLKLTPGKRFSLEAEEPAAPEIKSDFGPSEPPPQKLPSKSKGPKGQILPFMTPKIGNTMVGIGVLSIIGGVGYYIWKGGDIANLWDMIKPSFGGGSPQAKFFKAGQMKDITQFKAPAVVRPTRSTVPGYPAMAPDRY